MLGMFASFLSVTDLLLVLDPPKHGIGVELEHFAGLVQIALMRAVVFDDLQFRLSHVALSLSLARMLVVEGTLLERSEWIRSFCHLGSLTDRCRMEKRGENSEVTFRTYVFNTCNTCMRLLCMM